MANHKRKRPRGVGRPCFCKGKWDKYITGIPKPSIKRKLQKEDE